MNEHLIKEAQELRAAGHTIPEIAVKIKRSISAVSLYLNPEQMQAHRDRNRVYAKKLYQEKPEVVKARSSKWQAENRDKVNARQRRYWANNADRKRQYQREFYRAHFEKNPSQHRAHILRCALTSWMFGASKKRRDGTDMNEIVGCTPEQFCGHLESQFTGTMTWLTYGKDWEIDHIRPLIQFDMMDPEQAKVAMHYSNTRPIHPSLNRGRERREKLMGVRASEPSLEPSRSVPLGDPAPGVVLG